MPKEVYKDFNEKIVVMDQKRKKNGTYCLNQKNNYPERADELELTIQNELPADWDKELPVYEEGAEVATRSTSGEIMNAILGKVPHFIGGSANLAGSNKTNIKNDVDYMKNSFDEKNIWFGMREFAMAATLNGKALHDGLKVYGGTFFVFSDYLRPAVRLSSLMKMPVTYVFTHDSIAEGEDGPTHEPIEQLASLRAMAGLSGQMRMKFRQHGNLHWSPQIDQLPWF